MDNQINKWKTKKIYLREGLSPRSCHERQLTLAINANC